MKLQFTILICLLITAGIITVNSCRKSSFERFEPPTPISFNVPEGFPQPQYTFQNNPLTEEGFQLGRKLFHDSRLSKNIDVTCGSCHQQHAAYTTFDHDLGHGTNHQHTRRNVPVIFNMVWHSEFEWDGKNTNFEEQAMSCLLASEKNGRRNKQCY